MPVKNDSPAGPFSRFGSASGIHGVAAGLPAAANSSDGAMPVSSSMQLLASAVPKPGTPGRKPESARNKRPLLVVDDDENNRDMLSRRLRKAGYYVEVAASAGEALAQMEGAEMELLLLDNMMPGMSGTELLRLLRVTYSASDLPVIMVTAMSETKDIVEALNLGANDYITKPVDIAVALARIETQIRRKKAEEELADSRERLALAMRGTNDGMWDWDLRSGEIHYSARWKSMLGLGDDDVGISPEEWMRRVHRDDVTELRQLLANCVAPRANGDLLSEHRLRHADGSYRWMLCRAVVQRTADGTALRMAGCITDVNQSKARDPLTGLPNRLAFHEFLQDMLERRRAAAAYDFAVFFVDLDRFKLINDSLGHAAGDQLLMEIAQRLEAIVRSGKREGSGRPVDALARLGGDEFALVVEGVTDVEQARILGSRLLNEIAVGSQVVGKELFTTASIGVVLGSPEYSTSHQLIRDADTAMYRAKALGKNRCEVFDAAMREDAVFRLEMVNDLQRALSRNEFEVFYQPKVDVASQRIAGFEALLRWHHPTLGSISPTVFIPVAEETGLIVPIGLWILEEACRTMHRWHNQFPSEKLIEISVNLSVRQLRQPDLVAEVAAIIRRTGIVPAAIQLEITESILIDDPDHALKTLMRLKALGIGLKIDDFSTGYSSLRQLADMPFDSLKIDRTFIDRLCTGDAGRNMVRTIIALAKNLGVEVIAEGVETEEQFDMLATMGCNRVQGHYFSAAVGVADAEKILASPDAMPGTSL